jgi:hypothetical protein
VKNVLILGQIGKEILLSITNKMQRYTIFLITVNAVHVSGNFSAHHQELKAVHTESGICQACLLLPLAVDIDADVVLVVTYVPDENIYMTNVYQETTKCT